MRFFRFRLTSVPAPWCLLVMALLFCAIGLWLGVHQELSEHETLLLPGSGIMVGMPYIPGRHYNTWLEDWSHLESNGIFFYAFLLFWRKFDWQHAWQLRLPCLIAGTLCLPVLYGLGRRLQGRRLGICAAFLFGVNALALASVAHLRFYAFAMLFELLFIYSLHRAWEQECSQTEERSRSWRYVAWAALWGALAMSSMTLNALLMLVVLAVYLVASGGKRRHWLAGALLGAWLGLCALFLYLHDSQALNRILYATLPWWEQGGRSLFTCGFDRSNVPIDLHGQYLQTYHGEERLASIMWVMIATLAWGLLTALFKCWRSATKATTLDTRMLPALARVRLGLVCAPWIAAALLLAFSRFVHNVWMVPNLYFVLPLTCLSLGYGLAELPKIGRYAVVLCMVWSSSLWSFATYIDGYGEGLAWRTLQTWRRPTDYVLVHDFAGNWMRATRDAASHPGEEQPVILVPSHATASALEVVTQLTDIAAVTPGQATFVHDKFLPKLVVFASHSNQLKGHRLWILEKATERLVNPRMEDLIPAYFGDRQHDILCRQFGRERLWLIVDHRR